MSSGEKMFWAGQNPRGQSVVNVHGCPALSPPRQVEVAGQVAAPAQSLSLTQTSPVGRPSGVTQVWSRLSAKNERPFGRIPVGLPCASRLKSGSAASVGQVPGAVLQKPSASDRKTLRCTDDAKFERQAV